MLEKLVKKLVGIVGIEDLSNEDCIRIVRRLNLDKLKPHHLFLLNSCAPIITMCIKQLQMETIDWSELESESV
mgnify:CR=1 FL=1